MKEILRRFTRLNFQEILAQPVGAFDDDDLLEVSNFFKGEDDNRALAVTELILRSPAHSGLVDYHELYHELIEYYHFADDFPAALRWAYAMLAYQEQHEPGAHWPSSVSTLADMYLYSGDVDTGLALYARLLNADPYDIWTCNSLGLVLPDCGLADLAVEALQKGLSLTGHPDFAESKQQLEEILQDVVKDIESGELVTDLEKLDPRVLADYRAALAQAAEDEYSADEPLPYLPPVSRLVEAGQEQDEALNAEILAQGKLLAPELVCLAFDPSQRAAPASAQAIALLRQLRPAMENELTQLSDWLELADGNWQDELLADLFGKIGGYSSAELENYALECRYAPGLRMSALETLSDRAQAQPALRDQVVALLRTLMTRPEAYQPGEEELVGFAISFALDLDARELYTEIKTAFDEDRVEPTVIDLGSVHEEWGLPPVPQPSPAHDGMYLFLKCTACGRVRAHTAQYALIDQGSSEKEKAGQSVRFDPCILDHEIVCPKCGAQDHYELTSQANIVIYAPQDAPSLEAMLSGKEPESTPKLNPRVFFFTAMALGRKMHPFEALQEYEWRIANRPGDAHLHMGLGNILRLLFRYEQALEELRFAYELAPDDLDVIITLALAEHDLGERNTAQELYLKLQDLGRLKGLSKDNEDMLAASQGLEALQRGKPSPWSVPVYNADGQPLPISGRPFSPSNKTLSPGKAGQPRKRRK